MNTKRFTQIVFQLALVVSMLIALSACAAVQTGASLGAGEVISGMRTVIAEGSGTFILRFNDLYLLAWPKGSNYAFAVLGGDTGSALDALRVDTLYLSHMVRALESEGWQRVLPGSLPPGVLTALQMYSVEAAISALGNFMPTFYVFPSGTLLTLDDLQPTTWEQ